MTFQHALRQVIRHVECESPNAIMRGYVFCSPADCRNTISIRFKPKRNIGYVSRHLEMGMAAGAILLGALAIPESHSGGTLKFRTITSIFPVVSAALTYGEEEVSSLIGAEATAFVKKSVPDHIVHVAATTWDEPATKAVN